MFAKFVAFMSIASLLTMINNRLVDSAVLKLFVYGLMVTYVYWIISSTYKKYPQLYTDRKVVILFVLLTLNIISSPYDPLYPRLIKYAGYLGSFVFGFMAFERGLKFECSKFLLFLLVFVPLILIAVFDNTPHKTLFFTLSNTYSFFGLCCGLFIYTIYNANANIFKWSMLLVFAYIVSSSTLGIVSSLILAVFLINRRNIKLMMLSFVCTILGGICIMYIDIPIFLRIRDVVNLAGTLSWYDWAHLKDANFYNISLQVDALSDRDDNTSFLWRIAHWQFILDAFFENWWYSIPFGLGDGFANKECGNYCHNEYLKFLTENGVLVFSILISWVLKVHKLLQGSQVYYFILAILCYHLTENLIDTFVACVLFYFCLGYWVKRVQYNMLLLKDR